MSDAEVDAHNQIHEGGIGPAVKIEGRDYRVRTDASHLKHFKRTLHKIFK